MLRGNFQWIRKKRHANLSLFLRPTALQWALLEYIKTEGKIPHKLMTLSPQVPFQGRTSQVRWSPNATGCSKNV